MKWFFIIGGLIACTGKLVSASCPIQMSPPRVVVKFGDSLSANCSSLSSKIEGMGWESTYGGTGFKTGVSSLALNITSVKAWNIEPECYLNFPDGTQCLQNLPVTVYKMPERVSMSQSFSKIAPMVEGQQYRIQCDIVNVAPANRLSVIWHRGNKMVYNETFHESSQSPVNKSSVFNLTALRDDHGTDIWCEAKLNLWSEEQNLLAVHSGSREVAVLYPPAFTKPADETVEFTAGRKITLNCSATGNPMPKYRWHLPVLTQDLNNNQDVNQPILTPSFQVPGIYSCTASNPLGNGTKYFTVIEAARNRTTFAAIVGVFVTLGVLLFVGGLASVKPDGTFSFNKGDYLRGQPTSSGPV